MSVGIICKSDERKRQADEALRDYGIDPHRATAEQREMADCIGQKTNEAYVDAGRLR
ncbi:MAG: hypothetical protein ACI4D9_03905 [Lachnospiraceae bacterium]